VSKYYPGQRQPIMWKHTSLNRNVFGEGLSFVGEDMDPHTR